MHYCWRMHVRAHMSYKGYILLQFPCILHSFQDYLELRITKVRTLFYPFVEPERHNVE